MRTMPNDGKHAVSTSFNPPWTADLVRSKDKFSLEDTAPLVPVTEACIPAGYDKTCPRGDLSAVMVFLYEQ